MTKTTVNYATVSVQSGTAGHIYPKPDADVAVTTAPCDAKIVRPKNWGPGQNLEIKKGVKHIAQDGIGDSYPNDEFDLFYEVQEDQVTDNDPRASFLIGFWSAKEHSVKVQIAKKTKPAIVVGIVTNDMIGKEFENHEGTTELASGHIILQSPSDSSVYWAVSKKVYEKKYITDILPGKPEGY